MTRPPQMLDGAQVLRVADVADRRQTGKTRHIRLGREVEGIAHLAIAQYEGEAPIYLFYCDDGWTVLTDTQHETVEAAIDQAAFEFDGISFSPLGQL